MFPRVAHRSARYLIAGLAAWSLMTAMAQGAEIQGIWRVGTVATDSSPEDFTAGLDKSTLGSSHLASRLTVRVQTALPGDWSGSIVADADSQRSSVLDIQEASLLWRPVPRSPWRTRVRVGAFFPVTSLETSYDSIDWSPERTLSGAAVNSWLAEEIRIIGAELWMQWRGTLAGSPHSYSVRAGVFGGNDPAGTQVAWRGWNLAGRVTGLYQSLNLPDLPVYRPDGPIPAQTRNVHLFRELDERAGMYGAIAYAYGSEFEINLLRYDNRGDPLRLVDGQYSWRTRFDHLAVRTTLPLGWELLGQALHGDTLMGPNAVNVPFRAQYLLASHKLARGVVTLRRDWFQTSDRDILPDDDNSEHGTAWALAFRQPLPHHLTVIAEWLRVDSTRPARMLLGDPAWQIENRVGAELRWSF